MIWVVTKKSQTRHRGLVTYCDSRKYYVSHSGGRGSSVRAVEVMRGYPLGRVGSLEGWRPGCPPDGRDRPCQGPLIGPSLSRALTKLLPSIKHAVGLISTCPRTLALLPSKKGLCLLIRAANHIVTDNHPSSLGQMLRATAAQKSPPIEHSEPSCPESLPQDSQPNSLRGSHTPSRAPGNQARKKEEHTCKMVAVFCSC